MDIVSIIGLDEAGRGSIAGPIVAAAVLFRGLTNERTILLEVKDSKQLTVKRREKLFDLITDNFIWSVHVFSNRFIDRYGIQKANIKVIEKALNKIQRISTRKALVVSDYVAGAENYLAKKSAVNFYKKGERQFAEIAAASIIAKVYRDRLMRRFSKKYPNYGFCQHKGYGTKKHFQAIENFGLCPLHRRSFLNRYL